MRLILALLTTTLSPTFAKSVVYCAPSADLRDCHAYLESTPSLISASRDQRNQILQPEKSEELAKRLAKAQLMFTSASPQDSLEAFQKVIDLGGQAQWGESEQTVLLYSYLRIAQMREDRATQMMRDAARSLPLARLDTNLFPPPLTKRFEAAKAAVTFLSIERASFWPAFQLVIIDGQVWDLQKIEKFNVVDTILHITFLSDVYQPVQLNLLAHDLQGFQPAKIAWVDGSCTNPNVHGSGRAFFDSKCPDAVASLPSLSETQPSAIQTFTAPEAARESKTAFYQRGWFWLAAGSVAVATLVVSQQSQKSGGGSPSSRDGF